MSIAIAAVFCSPDGWDGETGDVGTKAGFRISGGKCGSWHVELSLKDWRLP